MNIIVILAGGTGLRFGGEVPKQYYKIRGKEIIGYVVRAAEECAPNNKTIIVADESDIQRLSRDYGVECTAGGATHNHSVKNGLDYIKAKYPDCHRVLFVDSVRPFVTSEDMAECFSILDSHDFVFAARHITDSLGNSDSLYIDRSPFYLIQKPEGGLFEPLYDAFDSESPMTAIVQHLPAGSNVKKHFSTEQNLKITHRKDLTIAEELMKLREKGEI